MFLAFPRLCFGRSAGSLLSHHKFTHFNTTLSGVSTLCTCILECGTAPATAKNIGCTIYTKLAWHLIYLFLAHEFCNNIRRSVFPYVLSRALWPSRTLPGTLFCMPQPLHVSFAASKSQNITRYLFLSVPPDENSLGEPLSLLYWTYFRLSNHCVSFPGTFVHKLCPSLAK